MDSRGTSLTLTRERMGVEWQMASRGTAFAVLLTCSDSR